MEASNLLSYEDDVTTPLIESNPSQNVTNLEPNPKGFISRTWNWLKKQPRLMILPTLLLVASLFNSWQHPPSGPPLRGPALAENRIMTVFPLVIPVVLLSGILSEHRFVAWVLDVVSVCVMCFQEVWYLREIADRSPDMSVDPMTMFLSYAWIFLRLLVLVVHTFYFVNWVVKEVILKAITSNNHKKQD